MTPGKEIVLERNRRYRGTRPRVPARIVVTIGGSPAQNIDRVERGEAELRWETINFEDEATGRRLVDRYGVNRSLLRRAPGSLSFRVVFNTRGRLFRDNVALRRAVNFALDRPELLRRVFAGRPFNGRRTDQTIPIGFPGWRDHHTYPLDGPDIATARRLARGNLRDGRAVLYAYANPRARRISEALAFQLSKIGIRVEITQLAPDVLEQRVFEPGEHWDMVVLGWQPDLPDPASFVIPLFGGKSVTGTWPGVNASRLDVPAINRRILDAQKLAGEARWQAFVDLDAQIVREYAPEAPFISGSWLFLVGPHLGCVQNHSTYWLALNTLCLKE